MGKSAVVLGDIGLEVSWGPEKVLIMVLVLLQNYWVLVFSEWSRWQHSRAYIFERDTYTHEIDAVL